MFGDRADLAELKTAELTPLTAVLKEHDAKIKERRAGALNDPAYIISVGATGMLVGDLFDLLAQYGYLRNRVLDVKNGAAACAILQRTSPATTRRSGCAAGGALRRIRASPAMTFWRQKFAARASDAL